MNSETQANANSLQSENKTKNQPHYCRILETWYSIWYLTCSPSINNYEFDTVYKTCLSDIWHQTSQCYDPWERRNNKGEIMFALAFCLDRENPLFRSWRGQEEIQTEHGSLAGLRKQILKFGEAKAHGVLVAK